MKVLLSHGNNPDIAGGGYWSVMDRPRKTSVEVSSYAEASRVCREYIEKYELGGGNWTGGTITVAGKKIARVSYNGRVWDMDEKEIKLTTAQSGDADA
jgi:hypothetical protein